MERDGGVAWGGGRLVSVPRELAALQECMEEHWLEGETRCWASLSIQKPWFLGRAPAALGLCTWGCKRSALIGGLVSGSRGTGDGNAIQHTWVTLAFWWIRVRAGFCDCLLQKEPRRRRNCWAGRWWGTGPTLRGPGKWALSPPPPLSIPSPHPHTPPLKLPHSQVLEDGNLILVSAFTSRDPNGEGLPLWPAYSQSEQYLKLDLNVSVGQKLKEREVEFWSDTLPLIMSPSTALPGPPPPLLSLSLLLPFFFSAPWGIVCDFWFSFCSFPHNH